MQSCKSRFSFGFCFSTLVVGLLLILGLYLFWHPQIRMTNRGSGTIPACTIAWFFIFLFLLIHYLSYGRAPKISIDPDEIRWKGIAGSRSIIAPQISAIRLFEPLSRGQRDFNDPQGIRIILTDDEAIDFPDHWYANMQELRKTLQQNFPALSDGGPLPAEPRSSDYFGSSPGETFRGSPFACFNGLFPFVVPVLGLVIFLSGPNRLPLLISFAAATVSFLAFYLGMAFQLFYFQLDNGSLIIRNHFFPWYRRAYALSDIRSLRFTYPSKKSQGIRIILQDFRTERFLAGSLPKRQWKAFEVALLGRGIQCDGTIAN